MLSVAQEGQAQDIQIVWRQKCPASAASQADQADNASARLEFHRGFIKLAQTHQSCQRAVRLAQRDR